MSNLRFKRFDSMKDSKRRIIENTKSQIYDSLKPVNERNKKGLYISTILLTSCIFFWGLIELITINEESTKQGNETEVLSFTGILSGTLNYSNEKFNFIPDESSIKEFPELSESISDTARIFFSEETEHLFEKFIGPGTQDYSTGAVISIGGLEIIDEYSYLAENVEIVEIVELPSEQIQYNDLFTFTLDLDEKRKVLLNSKLREIYKEFSNSFNKTILADLQPHEVFQLYEYAQEQNNKRVIYELIFDEEGSFKPTFEEFAEGKTAHEDINAPFKNNKLYIMYENENRAFVITKYKKHFFGLSKDSKGIWLVNYLPIQ